MSNITIRMTVRYGNSTEDPFFVEDGNRGRPIEDLNGIKRILEHGYLYHMKKLLRRFSFKFTFWE